MTAGGAPPTHADVLAAARRLERHVRRTRLVEAPRVSEAAGRRVLLKLENEQVCRCFKPRGAVNAALAASERGPVAGLITFSSGNHGQAVALAGEILGLPVVVVAPVDARATKLAAMQSRGAEVVLHGLTSDERKARASEIARERGLTLIPPYDHADVIAGQGTIGLEIAADAPGCTAVVVPVGGGGLSAGISLALAGTLQKPPAVIGVEPADADDLARSLEAGTLLGNARPSTSACDGLRNSRVGDLNWQVLHARLARAVTVTEDEVAEALFLLDADGITPVEPSGAAATASLLRTDGARHADTVVAIVSGGNA